MEYLYSNFATIYHKIRKSLKREHMVEISHKVLKHHIKLSYKTNHENWIYSGYYLFDSLWVKKNGK